MYKLFINIIFLGVSFFATSLCASSPSKEPQEEIEKQAVGCFDIFSTTPIHIQPKIMTTLSYPDFSSMMRVSKSWLTLIDNENTWESYRQQFPKLCKPYQQIEHLTLQKIVYEHFFLEEASYALLIKDENLMFNSLEKAYKETGTLIPFNDIHALFNVIDEKKSRKMLEFFTEKYNQKAKNGTVLNLWVMTLPHRMKTMRSPNIIEKKIKFIYKINKMIFTYKMKKKKQENLTAAYELNEELVQKGNEKAIQRKIKGLAEGGTYGYQEDLTAAYELNEALVQEGNEKASYHKAINLYYGRGGYQKNPKAAYELNEALVQKGNENAIYRKIEGLTEGQYGYLKDVSTAHELNEARIQEGKEYAIDRKIRGLLDGRNGYKKNVATAYELNEEFIQEGNEDAIYQKIEGLIYGSNGYQEDPEAARVFNEVLIKEGNLQAIQRKAWALARGDEMYVKDHPQLLTFIKKYQFSFFTEPTAIPVKS